MRIPKKRWVILLLSLLCLVAFFLSSDGYIVLKGIVNGERFYRGKPSSFWSKKIQGGQLGFSWSGRVFYVNQKRSPIPWLPGWIQQPLQKIGWPSNEVEVSVDSPDKDFVTLLLDLIKDDDPAVRRFAAKSIGAYQPVDKDAISALRKALLDEVKHVRSASARSLWNIAERDPGLRKIVEDTLREANTAAE